MYLDGGQGANAVPQFLSWLNSLTLPALLLAAWTFSRWYTKKETEVKEAYSNAILLVTTLRDNHLHHIEESMKALADNQGKTMEAIGDLKDAQVTAINASKDAIVAAILATRH